MDFQSFQCVQRHAWVQGVFDVVRIFGVNLHEGGRHYSAAADSHEPQDGGHRGGNVAGRRPVRLVGVRGWSADLVPFLGGVYTVENALNNTFPGLLVK